MKFYVLKLRPKSLKDKLLILCHEKKSVMVTFEFRRRFSPLVSALRIPAQRYVLKYAMFC